MAANRWKRGQSGNPSGHSGKYGEAMKLARRAAPNAVRRLIELIASEDERVAAVACNSILDRAFGKPKTVEEGDDTAGRLAAMTPRERLAEAERILAGAGRYLPFLEQVEAELGAAQQHEADEAQSTEG